MERLRSNQRCCTVGMNLIYSMVLSSLCCCNALHSDIHVDASVERSTRCPHLFSFLLLLKVYWFYNKELSLYEFENFIDKAVEVSVVEKGRCGKLNLHYGYADQENCFPFVPVERYNRKQALQERYVKNCKV